MPVPDVAIAKPERRIAVPGRSSAGPRSARAASECGQEGLVASRVAAPYQHFTAVLANAGGDAPPVGLERRHRDAPPHQRFGTRG